MKVFWISAFFLYSFFIFSVNAQNTDVADLLDAIDRMCEQEVPERDTGQIVELDGNVGAGVVARFFGIEAEGSISVEQYDRLNSQLKGLRRNTDDCKFEAFRLLKPAFIDGVSALEFDSIVDSCQSSGSLIVCVKTQGVAIFGSRVSVPLTFETTRGSATLQFKDGGGLIMSKAGEQITQEKDAGTITLYAENPVTETFSGNFKNASKLQELAIEIHLTRPLATTLWFDGIYVN